MRKFGIFILLFLSIFAGNARAQDKEVLTLDEVLKSSAQHFPEIKAAIAEINEKRGSVTEALGSFDASLKGEYYNRIEGYYDGQLLGSKIVKPFQDYGAEVSFGYRYSNGDFPVYEDYFFTNDGGELSASVSLSLLRDRDIDPERFKLNDSKLKLDQASISLLEKQLDIQLKAYKAYLDWIALGRTYRVYQSLLNIALERKDALAERVERGDAAEILLTENRQFILQRRESVIEAERKFENAANRLSLFLRDDDGDMIDIEISMLPGDFPIGDMDTKLLENDITRILDQNPAVQIFDLQMEMAENDIALGENNLLPALDLEMRIADDFGDGSGGFKREDPEGTIRLSASVPLQNRLGRGRVQSGVAKKNKAEFQKTLVLDQLEVNLKNAVNNIETAQELVDVTEDEIGVTRDMEDAERVRFENGQSDFFLINIRENNRAMARIKNIEALKYLSYVYADYLAMTLDLDALKLEN